MKNCINFVLSKVIHPYVRVIQVPYKKGLFQFPVSAANGFLGDIFEFFLCHFPCRSLLVSKNIYIIYVYKIANVPLTARGGGEGLSGLFR